MWEGIASMHTTEFPTQQTKFTINIYNKTERTQS